jgi:hypothetical protein
MKGDHLSQLIPQSREKTETRGGNEDEQPQAHCHFFVSLDFLARTAIDVLADRLNSNSRGVPLRRRSILLASDRIHRQSIRPIESS